MNKKNIYSILIIILLIVFSLSLIQVISANNYIEIEDEFYEPDLYEQNEDLLDSYNNELPIQVEISFNEDGSFSVNLNSDENYYELSDRLTECISNQSHNTSANITTLRRDLRQICLDYGLEDPNITITSPYGDDTFITSAIGVGISMEPTLKSGANLVLNKTHDVHVGDIVAIDSPKYGPICKRIARVRGDKVFAISDNVNGSYVKDGKRINYEGIRTWENISDIDGVAINVYQ